MARPTNLPEPWRSLAEKLGGAGHLYTALLDRAGIPERTAKRVCRGTGLLTYAQWCDLEILFREHGLTLHIAP